MVKKTATTPTTTARTCGLRGCNGVLKAPGTGQGCDNPKCTNHSAKWPSLVKAAAEARIAAKKEPKEESMKDILARIKAAKKKK